MAAVIQSGAQTTPPETSSPGSTTQPTPEPTESPEPTPAPGTAAPSSDPTATATLVVETNQPVVNDSTPEPVADPPTPTPDTPEPTNVTDIPTVGPTPQPQISSEDMLDQWPKDKITMCVPVSLAAFAPQAVVAVVQGLIASNGGGGSAVLIGYCGIATADAFRAATCSTRGDARADFTAAIVGVIGTGWTTEKTEQLSSQLSDSSIVCSGQSPVVQALGNPFVTEAPVVSFVDQGIETARSPVGIAVLVLIFGLMIFCIVFVCRKMFLSRRGKDGAGGGGGGGGGEAIPANADTEMDAHAVRVDDLQRN